MWGKPAGTSSQPKKYRTFWMWIPAEAGFNPFVAFKKAPERL